MHRRQLLENLQDDDEDEEGEDYGALLDDENEIDESPLVTSRYAGKLQPVTEIEPANPTVSDVEQQQIEALNKFLRNQLESPGGDPYQQPILLRDDAQKNINAIPWQQPSTAGARPPNDYTVTQINQTHDLLRLGNSDFTVGSADKQTSTEWLQSHGLETQGLHIARLVEKGKIGPPMPDPTTGKTRQHLTFDASDVIEFEYRIHLATEMYAQRIKWYLQGIRRVFGLVKGNRPAILIDASDANTGFGRMLPFQENLLHLIDEQISQRSGLYIAMIGTEPYSLWKNLMDVNCRTIEEAKQFVTGMPRSGGTNLMKTIKQIVGLKQVDSLVLILGSCPDQPSEILEDFIHQLVVGRDIPIHTVAYDCSNHQTNLLLRKLADVTGGRYHCFSSTCEEYIYTSTDIMELLQEMEKTQELLAKIRGMRQGVLDSAVVSIMNEISEEIERLPQSSFLPRPPGHDQPLSLDTPKFQPATSMDWLNKNGLKAKRLDLYQILAPNAYAYKEGFIPSVGKTVTSQVHEKAMVQFTWHDGSVRNVHVDLAQLFEYQKQLGTHVKVLETRINWLATGSRRLFGTVTEKNVIFLIDLSVNNVNYLIHIQHSLRLLLEQQMTNKKYFNMIGFGSQLKPFMPTVVPVNQKNLQAAWKWVQMLECNGSRNFMAALRVALENEEERQHGLGVEGIYLFTSGIPDQPTDVCVSFLEEAVAGRDLRLHTVLFNVDDYDANGAIPSRYANITKTADTLRAMAHSSGGRFHWFRETGIIESDDIRVLMAEIDAAVSYSRQCRLLTESVKKKYPDSCRVREQAMITASAERTKGGPKALPPPKETATSIARRSLTESKAGPTPIPKALAWRPQNVPNPMESVKASKAPFRRPVKSAFYTEEKNRVGLVFKDGGGSGQARKAIGRADIPDKEDCISSKHWMKRYSLVRMGLNLTKLLSGPEFRHDEKAVPPIQKSVEAKFCKGILPTVNVKGSLRHLQFTPNQLRNFEREMVIALRRYLKRLEWLMCGSRRVFGVVVEPRVVFLIDTSGSMADYLTELKEALKALVWEQLYKRSIAFNLISFNSTLKHWQVNSLAEPDEDTCHSAIGWVDSLQAHGNTCTLQALEAGLDLEGVDGVYLLTDGKPDTSTSTVLEAVRKRYEDNPVAVHTISFNCQEESANSFLKQLSTETCGRFHKVCHDFDARLFAFRVLEGQDGEGVNALAINPDNPPLPTFDGDDLGRLAREINAARRCLGQARYFHDLYFQQIGQTNASGMGDSHGRSHINNP